MLHYKNRKDKVHILTLDAVLAEDIYQRLEEYPGFNSVKLIKPSSESIIKPEDIQKKAQDTTTSKVLIIDVRSQTRPLLQNAYSDIVRFNRPDFNLYCYSVLIGDGPVNYFGPGGTEALRSYLADMRLDFSPAVFFGDPLLYYSYHERQDMVGYESFELTEKLPQRLEKYFHGDDLNLAEIRSYFRAANKDSDKRLKKRKQRLEVLEKMCIKLIQDECPGCNGQYLDAFKREGYAVPSESLKFNLYPFCFEELVLDLITRPRE